MTRILECTIINLYVEKTCKVRKPMIKSMTGFGHAEKVTKQQKITVELKSVNHRYLDLNIKMPRKFNMLEGQVRNLMKQYMQRGKVDVFITYEDYTGGNVALKYNHLRATLPPV